MKCFYHIDMDGKCSAAIVNLWDFARSAGLSSVAKDYIPINYNMTFPFSIVSENEEVVIVDFSLKEEDFVKLIAITPNIIWIDHHITAIEKANKIPAIKALKGIRRDGTAGCELTWEYFFKGKQAPWIVQLLGDYDVWAFKYGAQTKLLQAGIRLYDTKPTDNNWFNWFRNKDNAVDKLIKEGEIVCQYQKNHHAGLIKAWSFFTEFEGYKIVACNVGSASSLLFDSVEEDYDIMVPFCFDGIQWTVSLFTKKDIDVSKIALKYGGGGHKKAAGFQCKQLPFKK